MSTAAAARPPLKLSMPNFNSSRVTLAPSDRAWCEVTNTGESAYRIRLRGGVRPVLNLELVRGAGEPTALHRPGARHAHAQPDLGGRAQRDRAAGGQKNPLAITLRRAGRGGRTRRQRPPAARQLHHRRDGHARRHAHADHRGRRQPGAAGFAAQPAGHAVSVPHRDAHRDPQRARVRQLLARHGGRHQPWSAHSRLARSCAFRALVGKCRVGT